MPDIDDFGPGHGPGPDFEHGHGPNGTRGFRNPLYESGTQDGSSVGLERNADRQDEKLSESDIKEIKWFHPIKRHKAKITYKRYRYAYGVYKRRMQINKFRLERINKKLKKYAEAGYPDDAVNRDKIVRKKQYLEYELSEDQKGLSGIIKDKMNIYGKSLGYGLHKDEDFIVYGNDKISIPSAVLDRIKNAFKNTNQEENSNEDNSSLNRSSNKTVEKLSSNNNFNNINKTNSNVSEDNLELGRIPALEVSKLNEDNPNLVSNNGYTYVRADEELYKKQMLEENSTYSLTRNEIIDSRYKFISDKSKNLEMTKAIKSAALSQEEQYRKILAEVKNQTDEIYKKDGARAMDIASEYLNHVNELNEMLYDSEEKEQESFHR